MLMPIKPYSAFLVIIAESTEENAHMKIAGVNRLCASSNANVMPVSGALNATASPAHAPPVI